MVVPAHLHKNVEFWPWWRYFMCSAVPFHLEVCFIVYGSLLKNKIHGGNVWKWQIPIVADGKHILQHFNRQLCRRFTQVRPSLLCNNAYIFSSYFFYLVTCSFQFRMGFLHIFNLRASRWLLFFCPKKVRRLIAHYFSDYIKCNRELHVNVSMTLLSGAQLLINYTASPAVDYLVLQLALTNWVIPRRAVSCWNTNLLRCFSPLCD